MDEEDEPSWMDKHKEICTCCGKWKHLATYVHKDTYGPPIEQWCAECSTIYNMLGWLKL